MREQMFLRQRTYVDVARKMWISNVEDLSVWLDVTLGHQMMRVSVDESHQS